MRYFTVVIVHYYYLDDDVACVETYSNSYVFS